MLFKEAPTKSTTAWDRLCPRCPPGEASSHPEEPHPMLLQSTARSYSNSSAPGASVEASKPSWCPGAPWGGVTKWLVPPLRWPWQWKRCFGASPSHCAHCCWNNPAAFQKASRYLGCKQPQNPPKCTRQASLTQTTRRGCLRDILEDTFDGQAVATCPSGKDQASGNLLRLAASFPSLIHFISGQTYFAGEVRVWQHSRGWGRPEGREVTRRASEVTMRESTAIRVGLLVGCFFPVSLANLHFKLLFAIIMFHLSTTTLVTFIIVIS